MLKYGHTVVYLVVFLVGIAASGCRSSFEKRVNKDIVGINEQLYDLEKEQIKAATQLQELKKGVDKAKQEEKQNQKEKDKNNLEQIYKDGYKNYLEQDYPKAIQLFSELTAKFNDSSLVDNALYWQAESYYKSNQIDQALKYYQLVYRYFPFSNKADYSLYKIGMVFYNREDYSRALLAFTKLTREYPSSDLYKAASIKINQIKKDRKRRKR